MSQPYKRRPLVPAVYDAQWFAAEFGNVQRSQADGPFLPLKGGTLTGPLQMGAYDRISESDPVAVPASTATAIFSAIAPSTFSAIVLVTGIDASSNWFSDLVHVMGSNTATAISSHAGGAPSTRTYTVSLNTLSLTIATAQTRVRVVGMAETNAAA